jgi:hypothetical protein
MKKNIIDNNNKNIEDELDYTKINFKNWNQIIFEKEKRKNHWIKQAYDQNKDTARI